jgi:5-methylcytosine-specific restriction endonuclease McrA
MTNSSIQQVFNTIVGQSIKDNTYKFALTKFLLDHAHTCKTKDECLRIEYKQIAEKFLEYYWFQECKYKLKQDFKVERMPVIIRIIRKYCGEEYIAESYEKYFKSKSELKEKMISEIERTCLQDVIPRLQPKDNYTLYRHYHTLSSNGKKYRLPPATQRYIEIDPETFLYFKQYYHELTKLLIYEWAKFLERTNFTPRLIAKLESLGIQKRKSLTKFKKILLHQMDAKCFYCNDPVYLDNLHIDHFIPWSYIFEDDIWNLVISCSDCNLKKSDALAPIKCVEKIEQRNKKYNFNQYGREIREYYENCYKAGFSTQKKIDCV